MKQTFTLQNLSETVEKLLLNVTNKTLLFYGDMAVGKTTFIKELAKKLGVTDTINSPTFSIVNEYVIENDKVYHFDFYRIEKEEEALDIGIEEYFYSNHWVLIEWPNKIKTLLPKNSSKITLIKNENGSRTLHLSPPNLVDK